MSQRGAVRAAGADSPGRKARRRFWRRATARVGVLILVTLLLASLLAPWVAPYGPAEIDLASTLQGPSAAHWLGTDENGRDVLSRLVWGGRVSLAVGMAAMLASVTLGTLLGALAGFLGGWADTLISRTIDGMLSIPLFFFLLTALALLGPSLPNLVLAIALTGWMTVARIVRGEILASRAQPFVEAATALGASPWHILFRHALPQSFPSIIVAATLGVAYAILTESALSYLGLGVQPPTPSWGNMLSDARGYAWQLPMLAFYPGATIFVAVLAFNAVGDALRDATDPR